MFRCASIGSLSLTYFTLVGSVGCPAPADLCARNSDCTGSEVCIDGTCQLPGGVEGEGGRCGDGAVNAPGEDCDDGEGGGAVDDALDDCLGCRAVAPTVEASVGRTDLDAIPMTSLHIVNLKEVEDDGAGGAYVRYFLDDTRHVDAGGTQRHLAREFDAVAGTAHPALARVGDGVVHVGRGTLVHVDRATWTVRLLGTPLPSTVVAASFDEEGLVVVDPAAGAFRLGTDGSWTNLGLSSLTGGGFFGAVTLRGGGIVHVETLLGSVLVLDGAQPVELLDLGEQSAVLAPSALADRVLYVATSCSLFRIDVDAPSPTPTNLFASGPCTSPVLGVDVSTSRLTFTSMVAVAGTADDVLIGVTDDGRVVRVPTNSADGAPLVMAGGGVAPVPDGMAATDAALVEPSALASTNDGAVVFVDPGIRIVRFTIGGTLQILAGAGAGAEGFVDGDASQARFRDVVALAPFGQGSSLWIVEPANVRLFDASSATVATVSPDQFAEDGPLAAARLARPEGIACLGDACLVDDDGTATLRIVDLAAGVVATVLGREGATVDAGDVTVAEGGFLFSDTVDDVILRVDDSFAGTSVFAQRAAVSSSGRSSSAPSTTPSCSLRRAGRRCSGWGIRRARSWAGSLGPSRISRATAATRAWPTAATATCTASTPRSSTRAPSTTPRRCR